MTESELKFEVPAQHLELLRRAVSGRTATRHRLRALYFDTAGGHLAAAGLTLRLRREDRRWVQALEAADGSTGVRLEHEVAVKGANSGADMVPNVAVHDGTPAGKLLRDAVKDPSALRLRFETDVYRTRRRLRSDDSLIEVAFDEGAVRAGDRTSPLCEIEFELVRGPSSGLVELVSQWIEQHGLWLDVRSKGEKGNLLLDDKRAGPAVRARPSPLAKHLTPDAALRTVVMECLVQLLPNLTALAAGAAQPDHLHQVRVAVRRLRTALRNFSSWSDGVDSGWEPDLAVLLRGLSAARDRDALSATLFPQMRSAGAPVIDLPRATDAPDPGQLARLPATGRLMVALLAFAHGTSTSHSEQHEDLRSLARPMLRQLHKQLIGDGKVFLGESDARKHRTRRRLKRLRYCVEFLSPLFAAKRVDNYLKVLEPAQDALGAVNDAAVAQRAYRALSEQDPRAWFAVGWLAARRSGLQELAAAKLRELDDVPRFWRGHGRS